MNIKNILFFIIDNSDNSFARLGYDARLGEVAPHVWLLLS